jgi:hypothetical protein
MRARQTARGRFGMDRFVKDWLAVINEVVEDKRRTLSRIVI